MINLEVPVALLSLESLLHLPVFVPLDFVPLVFVEPVFHLAFLPYFASFLAEMHFVLI